MNKIRQDSKADEDTGKTEDLFLFLKYLST